MDFYLTGDSHSDGLLGGENAVRRVADNSRNAIALDRERHAVQRVVLNLNDYCGFLQKIETSSKIFEIRKIPL